MNAPILYAESDPFFRQIYEARLRAAGYEVVCAAHGERVIELVEQLKPAALILSLVLPRKDGFEVLDALQSSPVARELPIVVISRIGSRDVVERCMKSGACDYLIKGHHQAEDLITCLEKRLLNRYTEEV